jgi:hypothetical protein
MERGRAGEREGNLGESAEGGGLLEEWWAMQGDGMLSAEDESDSDLPLALHGILWEGRGGQESLRGRGGGDEGTCSRVPDGSDDALEKIERSDRLIVHCQLSALCFTERR